MNYRQEAQLS